MTGTTTHCSCECHRKEPEPVGAPPGRCGDDCCGGKAERPCPPPPIPCHPGTVRFPHTPGPTFEGTEAPPSVDKPTDPAQQGAWFRDRVREIHREGPSLGRRKDEFLPWLVARTKAGDRGARPIGGRFWESPDIFVADGVAAETAPLRPPFTAGIARVGVPNTVYAHVWNLGRAPVYGARVEFYWFNPTLGITYDRANFIGAGTVDLGDRFTSFPSWREARSLDGTRYLTQGCHAVVPCPNSWFPTFENDGHECLVVRVFEPILDAIRPTDFDARRFRHVAQRNIAVVRALSPAAIDLALQLGRPDQPGQSDVEVVIEEPSAMPWLELFLGRGNRPLAPATGPFSAGLLPPLCVNLR